MPQAGGKWLDVYRRRPQGLELDLLEYGNLHTPTGSWQKIDPRWRGGQAPMSPPAYAPGYISVADSVGLASASVT